MSLRAGFAEIDITPPLGTHRIGWLKDIIADHVLDPLFARVALLESGGETIAFVQLDTLTVRWTTTQALRDAISERYCYPGNRVMVSATHNHAGPAVANCGDVRRDEGYVADLIEKVTAAFGEAHAALRPAEVGLGSGFNADIARNRRVVMRDGTVRTHGTFDDPEALYIEGPIDPEVAVLAARDKQGNPIGCIVNYACHPAHHGGTTALSAGYPGVLAAAMKDRGWPVTLFLNGAAGNIHSSDPARSGADWTMEEVGKRLSEDAQKVIAAMDFRENPRINSQSATLSLPYREITEEACKGTVRGAQRFIDPAIYDRGMPDLVARIRTRGTQPAEVQVHHLDEYAFVGVPAEYFVELGPRIKVETYPRHTLVVSHANGNVGYVPHKDAFARGGYETTFTGSSRMAPEAGDILADRAIAMVQSRAMPA